MTLITPFPFQQQNEFLILEKEFFTEVLKLEINACKNNAFHNARDMAITLIFFGTFYFMLHHLASESLKKEFMKALFLIF